MKSTQHTKENIMKKTYAEQTKVVARLVKNLNERIRRAQKNPRSSYDYFIMVSMAGSIFFDSNPKYEARFTGECKHLTNEEITEYIEFLQYIERMGPAGGLLYYLSKLQFKEDIYLGDDIWNWMNDILGEPKEV